MLLLGCINLCLGRINWSGARCGLLYVGTRLWLDPKACIIGTASLPVLCLYSSTKKTSVIKRYKRQYMESILQDLPHVGIVLSRLKSEIRKQSRGQRSVVNYPCWSTLQMGKSKGGQLLYVCATHDGRCLPEAIGG